MRELDDDTIIWRYMRLAPFMEMIMHFALFQTRVSEFDDPLEGAYGYNGATLDESIVEYLELPRDRTFHVFRRDPKPADPAITVHPVQKEDAIREARLHTCVACWYEHDQNESYAMWRIYGADSFAVAIETTVGALRKALNDAGNLIIGGVDYTPLPTRVETVHELFFHKRPEFATEREIRSVQVFPERISGAVQLEALSADAMDGLLRAVIAAPGMRETMFTTLYVLINSLFLGRGVEFAMERFRHSNLDAEQLPQ